jgi:hypothetical protein
MKLLVLERQFKQEYADIGNLSMNISRFYAVKAVWLNANFEGRRHLLHDSDFFLSLHNFFWPV